MKLFRCLMAVLAVTSVLISCKKDYSDEDGKIPGIIETTWEFKGDGQQFNGDMDSAYFQSSGGFSALTMIGSSTTNPGGEIILQILGEDIGVGTYNSPNIFFQYSDGSSIIYQTVPGQTANFSITITSIDSVSIQGTFTGSVQDAQGGQHEITDGKFSVKMTGRVDGPAPDGQLTVWAKEICFDGGAIEIKVADQTGFITDALLVEPACGAQDVATFTLPQGIYTVIAICSNDTIQYEVNVNSDCVKLLVDFENPPLLEDYLPLTIGSYWDYRDLGAGASTTQRITATSDTVLEGRQYTTLISNIQDTFYYRKDGNVYYEYRTFDFNDFVQNPPSFEMVILYDNYEINQSWETAAFDINQAGVDLKTKLVSTIISRDYTQTIGGVEYTDLIAVETEIFFSTDNGNSFIPSGNSYVTVFSKGKGIVYYYDIERATEWGASGTSIVPQ